MSVALNREEKLLENISKLMARSSFNDLRIKLTNGVQVDANKVILAAMSPFVDPKLHEKITSDQFLARAILSYFLGVADFFLVPGRDKYAMWDRLPLRQFDRDRL